MARHTTKPISLIENAVKALQQAKQYQQDVAKGHFSYPLTAEQCQINVQYAREHVLKIIERYTQPVDYSLPESERPKVIRGY